MGPGLMWFPIMTESTVVSFCIVFVFQRQRCDYDVLRLELLCCFINTTILKNSRSVWLPSPSHLLCPLTKSTPFLTGGLENWRLPALLYALGCRVTSFGCLLKQMCSNDSVFSELWNNLEKLFEETCSQVTNSRLFL